MNLLVKLIACILVYDAIKPITADVICGPGDTYLPNPVDCTSFYQCSNGVPILLTCAPNHNGTLVFDPNLNVCVWPDAYYCQISTEAPTSQITEIFTPCHEYSRPTTCHRSPNNCSFCYDCLGKGIPRCDTHENLLQAGCQTFNLNQSQYHSVIETNSRCIHIPPGEKRNITLTFSLEKHPLDLYYLMDTTGSMADDKVNLVSLSSSFLATLANLTNDFHIGFGTFKDKPMFPSNGDDYSFHNDLPLTSKTDDFVKKINATLISGGGGDGPEGCGDALAQVVECYEQIGWRENTRRVVLVATDDVFHIAGVGQSFNITAPYVDGCYLDSEGFYTETLAMDFPSIEQLASAYSETPVTTTVIFATSSGGVFYQNVASQFKSAYVGELKSDSSNIVELIKNEFARIESKMEIEKSETTDTVHFKYYSNCMAAGGERETAICENMPASGEVTFTVQIDLSECPVDEDETGMIIDFNPVGLPVFIEVELIYLCD